MSSWQKSIQGMVVVALVCSAGVGAGCGGDSSTTASLTKAEFVKEGNAICKAGVAEKNAEIEAGLRAQAKEDGGKPMDQAAQEKFVTEVAVPPVRAMVEELDELGLPSQGAKSAEAIIEEMERALKTLEEDPALALGTEDPFTAANAKATKYGLKECAQL